MNFPVLIGLTKIDALQILSKLRLSYRIVIEDSKIYAIDNSVRQDRANLVVKKGIIHSYTFY
jgi:hypothetical protein